VDCKLVETYYFVATCWFQTSASTVQQTATR